MIIKTFSPFGYEGSMVTVETDLRRGIPSVDIVGLADGSVRESRERMKAAVINSGFQFPAERVLMSLSPADLRKEGVSFDLPMALSVITQQEEGVFQNLKDKQVYVTGELELSGKVRPVRAINAGLQTAFSRDGVKYAVVPEFDGIQVPEGMHVEQVKSLKEAHEALVKIDMLARDEKNLEDVKTAPDVSKNSVEVEFQDKDEFSIYDVDENTEFNADEARAIEIAVAGKLGLFVTGAPGCGKTVYIQRLVPALTPKLTQEESVSTSRIRSLAGLDENRPGRDRLPPFRMPHQTASIEGIFGGGIWCHPGEISLAQNGTLFLDEAAEFRGTVLTMMRVPVKTHSITLSRAGRSTVFPAKFQLVAASNPCPCGNFGNKNKPCLCSQRSVDQYRAKLESIVSNVEIKQVFDKDHDGSRHVSVAEMRKRVSEAYRIQRERGIYNGDLNPAQVAQYCVMDDKSRKWLDGMQEEINGRERDNLLKVALTVANMDGRTEIKMTDMIEARTLTSPIWKRMEKDILQERHNELSPDFDKALEDALKEAGCNGSAKEEKPSKAVKKDYGMEM